MNPKQIWPLVGANIHGCHKLVVYFNNGSSTKGYFPKSTPLPMIINNQWLFIPTPDSKPPERIEILDGNCIERIETALGLVSLI